MRKQSDWWTGENENEPCKEIKSTVTNTSLTPVSIDRIGETAINITWSDGAITTWTVAKLRKACPCATCREKRGSGENQPDEPSKPTMLPVLSAAEAQPLRIESMNPVGLYAYSIAFSDGHSSGIYPFGMLHDEAPE
jgi:DUF971 family protein